MLEAICVVIAIIMNDSIICALDLGNCWMSLADYYDNVWRLEDRYYRLEARC